MLNKEQKLKFMSFLKEQEEKHTILAEETCGETTWVDLLNKYRSLKVVPGKGMNDIFCVCCKRTAVIHDGKYILFEGDFRKEMVEFGFEKDFFEVFGMNVEDYEVDIMGSIPMYF